MNFNRTIVAGRLTADPAFHETDSGGLATMTVAVNRYWKDRDGNKKEAVDFIPLVIFGDRGRMYTDFLGKGQQVLVEGKLRIRERTVEKKTIQELQLVADFIEMGAKPRSKGDSTEEPTEDEPTGSDD